MLGLDGKSYRPYLSVDDALDRSLNTDFPDDVQQRAINMMASALDISEGLLLLARTAIDYERSERACRSLADKLSRALGYDEPLVFDILRELSNLAPRYKFSHHARRLGVSRKQIALWKKTVITWAAAAEFHAKNIVKTDLEDAGLI